MNKNKEKNDLENFINRTMKNVVVIQSELPPAKHEEKKSCVSPEPFKPIVDRWYEFIKKTYESKMASKKRKEGEQSL